MSTYDDQNVFAKILRGEIPNKTVLETEHALAFEDIAPQAPLHVLVIPKGAYTTFDDFAARATAEEIADFMQAVGRVAREAGVAASDGYRVLSNAGAHAEQEVPHFHMHVVGGRPLGRILAPSA